MTPEEKRDKYYRKTYGVGLDFYNSLFELQNGKCAICGRPPKDKNFNLDHRHFKVLASRSGRPEKGWIASVPEFKIWRWAKKKNEAIQLVKEDANPLSIRGLLCPGRYAGCNRKLGRLDDIQWLENAIKYLKDPPARQLRNKETPCEKF